MMEVGGGITVMRMAMVVGGAGVGVPGDSNASVLW